MDINPRMLIRLTLTLGVVALMMGAVSIGLAAPDQTDQPEVLLPSGQSTAGLRVVQSDDSGLVLELLTPVYTFVSNAQNGIPYQELTAAGLSAVAEMGRPRLPMAGGLIGVPPDAKVTMHVLADKAQVLTGKFVLLPAPSPVAAELEAGKTAVLPDAGTYSSDSLYPPQLARIAAEAWLRDQRLVRVEVYPFQYSPLKQQVTWHRTIRVAVRFDRTAARMPDAIASSTPTATDVANPFEVTLRDSLLNYEQARGWRAAPATFGAVRNLPTASQATHAATPRYKIIVDHDGVYRVTYTELLAAGLAVTNVAPSNFHMTSQGRDVAIEVTGEGDGQFNPGDSIVFYGQKLRGDILAERFASEDDTWLLFGTGWRAQFTPFMVERYTDDNVYWLTTDGPPGPRMSIVNGTPSGTAVVPQSYTATVRAEQANIWRTITFTGEDPFFWEFVSASGRVTRTYPITLTAVANAAPSATVRGEIVGWTFAPANPDHHTLFYMNATPAPLEDALWDGPTRHRFTGLVSPANLLEGQNQLSFVISPTAALSPDQMYFDWFDVNYARRFTAQNDQLGFSFQTTGSREFRVGGLLTNTVRILDTSDPFLPRRITSPAISGGGGTYTAAFEINPSAPMTYFVSSEAALQSAKTISQYIPIDLSGGTGADYIIVTHRAFYTGVQTLADHRAAQGWRVRVIDVADVYNQYTDGVFHPLAIKAFLADAYANWPKPAPAYVLLVGDGHWNFKNYSVSTGQGQVTGSAPIYMPPNLEWVDPFQGEVDSTNMLAAVAGNDILPDLSIGRLLVNNLDELNAVISKTINYEQAGVQPFQGRVTFVADNTPDPKGAGDFIASSESVINNYLPKTYTVDRIYENNFGCTSFVPCPAVNYALTRSLNFTGALILNYTGHGAIPNWSDERIFVNADINTLANANRLPVILSMTCLDGYWLHPRTSSHSSLAELNVRAANGGAVAAFSPTGLGVAWGHDYLEQGFFTAVFSNGVQRLGPATVVAKLRLFSVGAYYDLIQTFTIIGDPALRLPTYALTMTPAPALTGVGGSGAQVAYTLRITNTAFMTDVLTFNPAGNLWPISFPAVSIPPGTGRDVVMTVTIPVTAAIGSHDSVTVTINSHGDATRLSTVLKTTVIKTYGLFLPIIRRTS